MPNFQWKGDGLKAVASVLATRGWVPGTTGVRVVRTARALLPEVKGEGWVWLSGERPGA